MATVLYADFGNGLDTTAKSTFGMMTIGASVGDLVVIDTSGGKRFEGSVTSSLFGGLLATAEVEYKGPSPAAAKGPAKARPAARLTGLEYITMTVGVGGMVYEHATTVPILP